MYVGANYNLVQPLNKGNDEWAYNNLNTRVLIQKVPFAFGSLTLSKIFSVQIIMLRCLFLDS